MHALADSLAPNAIKVLGNSNVELVILVDTGSSHSFIQPRIVEHQN